MITIQVREVQKRLMVMCSQIASGMEYLAGEKYVHRDWLPGTACEPSVTLNHIQQSDVYSFNVRIDTHFQIKITDFGLSEDVFERNYFRQDSSSGEVVKLPIKWMAPESLSDGHFSEKSDVVRVIYDILTNILMCVCVCLINSGHMG